MRFILQSPPVALKPDDFDKTSVISFGGHKGEPALAGPGEAIYIVWNETTGLQGRKNDNATSSLLISVFPFTGSSVCCKRQTNHFEMCLTS
jgi:hypothetical protein